MQLWDIYIDSESTIKDLQNYPKTFRNWRYYKFLFGQNLEIPWKNTIFYEKPILSSNFFSIFKIYIFLESRDDALQTNEEIF